MELVLQRYSWAMLLAAAALAAFLAARTVNTFVATALLPRPTLATSGPSALPTGQLAQHATLDLPRFAKAFDVPVPKPPEQLAADGDAAAPAKAQAAWNPVAARSSLHGVLVGTARAEPARFSLCQIINTDTNEANVYALNERFMGARIYAVEKDRVLVDNDGRNEYIDNNAAAPTSLGVQPLAPAVASDGSIKQIDDTHYSIKKTELDKALGNLSELATQARIVPSFKNGVANGFKLFSIVPDSLYSKIGIQNGDVIHRINGYDMNSPDKALEIYQKLRDASRVEVELERRGDTVKKSYTIE